MLGLPDSNQLALHSVRVGNVTHQRNIEFLRFLPGPFYPVIRVTWISPNYSDTILRNSIFMSCVTFPTLIED